MRGAFTEDCKDSIAFVELALERLYIWVMVHPGHPRKLSGFGRTTIAANAFKGT